MHSSPPRVVVTGDPPPEDDAIAAVRTRLDGVDVVERSASAERSDVDRPESASGAVACIVHRSRDRDSALGVLSAVRSAEDSPPVVAIVEDAAATIAALEADAADAVRAADVEEQPALLAVRVERVVARGPRSMESTSDRSTNATAEPSTYATSDTSTQSAAGRRPDPAALLSAIVDEDELVCLFDERHRHVAAVGAAFDGELRPAALEGVGVRDAFADRPDVAAHLDVNYAAARGGNESVRELAIGERTYRVETVPISSGSGLVRFTPAVAAEEAPSPPSTERTKVHRLHDIASELDAATSEAEIFELAVDSAERVLEFDACVAAEVEDGMIVPRAATAPELAVGQEYMRVEDGIAGRTVREGRTLLVEDVHEETTAKPSDDAYRSALSIPIGDDGVFQAISTEVGGYTDRDRKLAELLLAHVTNALERVRYQEALTVERDRFAALFENVPDAAVQYAIVDGEPRIESVNSAFVRLFGFEPDDAIGKTTAELLVPDEERERAIERYDAIANGDRVDCEVRRLTATGVHPFLLRSVPVVTDGADRHGYLIYTDLGELKRRERELTEQNERLDRFASVVSHDLRNPLSVASAYVEQARATEDLSLLAEVERSLERSFAIVDDVLTLAREGEAVTETSAVDLRSIVDETWGGVATADATVDVADDLTLAADESRFRQLLENLFRNAIEHGGEEVAVTVGRFEDGVYVADDGPGFPDGGDDVFEYGYSTAEDGTGFGLPIVREIAEGHGWSVRATEAGEGGARIELVGIESIAGG